MNSAFNIEKRKTLCFSWRVSSQRHLGFFQVLGCGTESSLQTKGGSSSLQARGKGGIKYIIQFFHRIFQIMSIIIYLDNAIYLGYGYYLFLNHRTPWNEHMG